MSTEELRAAADYDQFGTVAFYLLVPRSHLILLQAYFELYDGVGTVRTINTPAPVVCVMTTADMADDCMKVLSALRDEIHWTVTERPAGGNQLRYENDTNKELKD